jgi:hypothetical protein
VEQLGAGSEAEGVEAFSEAALELRTHVTLSLRRLAHGVDGVPLGSLSADADGRRTLIIPPWALMRFGSMTRAGRMPFAMGRAYFG